MSETPYFDAYMRGERSKSYKWRNYEYWRNPCREVEPTLQTITIPPGTYYIDNFITPLRGTRIRGEGFRPTYIINS